MGHFISPDAESRIHQVMFKGIGSSPEAQLFATEMGRYASQLAGKSDSEIKQFMDYAREVWLFRIQPKLGKPVPCLNPQFRRSVEDIPISSPNINLYTRASVKENGYRLQLHVGPHDADFHEASAFTRQFNRYDLRMFPELRRTLDVLPVMVGDSELVSKHSKHNSGFNRVQDRIPVQCWPKAGARKLDDELIEEYLSDAEFFKDRWPKEEFELTLAFHGLLAIARPDTWEESRKVQADEMISLCRLPMDYQKVDWLLDQLSMHLASAEANARVVEREVIDSREALRKHIKRNEERGLEGTVVVQYAENKNGTPLIEFARSIKIKSYETIDCALLGLYLLGKERGLAEENISGALLGIFDDLYERHLPICTVNLDPAGAQVREEFQTERLADLRKELAGLLKDKPQRDSSEIATLYDIYLAQSKIKLSLYLEDRVNPDAVASMIDSLPRGKDFKELVVSFDRNREKYEQGELGTKSSSLKVDQWMYEYRGILSEIAGLQQENRDRYRDVLRYFSSARDVRLVSSKLRKPQYVVGTTDPVIIEIKVLKVDSNRLTQFPAGFHSWRQKCWYLDNKYPERIRHDKSTTTDRQTIIDIARQHA